MARMVANADLLEAYAVLAFNERRGISANAAPGEDQKINPSAISLEPSRWEADGLFDGSGMTIAEARASPAGAMENLFHGGNRQPA